MSSLDDFFAKKDKKPKLKSHYLAADDLYRTLEEATKASSSAHASAGAKSTNKSTSLEFKIRFTDDDRDDEEDEWCDFTEEHSQQYMGLPRLTQNTLRNLRRGASNKEIEAERTDVDVGGDASKAKDQQKISFNYGAALTTVTSSGDGIGITNLEKSSSNTCPWQTMKKHEAEPQMKMDKTEDSKKSVYVPPALRNQQEKAPVNGKKKQPPKTQKMPKGEAPDLNSTEFFPSLSSCRMSKRNK